MTKGHKNPIQLYEVWMETTHRNHVTGEWVSEWRIASKRVPLEMAENIKKEHRQYTNRNLAIRMV